MQTFSNVLVLDCLHYFFFFSSSVVLYPFFCKCIGHRYPNVSLLLDDDNESVLSTKRSFDSDTDGFSDVPTTGLRKRRKRILLSSDDEDESGSLRDTTSGESGSEENEDDANGYESFEELSEDEERRRRVGDDHRKGDARYFDPDLYCLRRSSRQRGRKSEYVVSDPLLFSYKP